MDPAKAVLPQNRNENRIVSCPDAHEFDAIPSLLYQTTIATLMNHTSNETQLRAYTKNQRCLLAVTACTTFAALKAYPPNVVHVVGPNQANMTVEGASWPIAGVIACHSPS